jgi:hypothetical protein
VVVTERLEILSRLRNLTCHEYTADGLLVSRRNRLFLIPDLAAPRLAPVGRIPWGPAQWPGYVKLADSVLKAGIQRALRVGAARYLVAARKRWWLLTADGGVRDLGALAIGRPLARGLCVESGTVYLAEYRSNPHRGPVRVLQSADLARFEEAWRFPARTVRHVHALVPDPYQEARVWILTGDFDHESVIWYTDDHFASVHRFLNLGQRTRATDMLCLPDRLVWGMDSPLETPYVLDMSRAAGSEPQPVQRLEGPAYYATRNEAGGCYMGTTVEPGPAVTDDFGRLYAWAPGQRWCEVARWRHVKLPQYGIINLPRGVLPGTFVVCSTRALSPGNGYLTIARDRALER